MFRVIDDVGYCFGPKGPHDTCWSPHNIKIFAFASSYFILGPISIRVFVRAKSTEIAVPPNRIVSFHLLTMKWMNNEDFA